MIAAAIMRRDPTIAHVEHSVFEAAVRMREQDTGILFVVDGDELVGALTDRDIALRVVADRRDPLKAKVLEAMTKHVVWVGERTKIDVVAKVMARERVRRVAVLNEAKELVGMINFPLLIGADVRPHNRSAAMEAIYCTETHGKKPHADDPAGGRAKGLESDEGYAMHPKRRSPEK